MSPLDPVRVSGLQIPMREIGRRPGSDGANEVDVYLAAQTTCLAEVVAADLAGRADHAEVLEQVAQSVVSVVSADSAVSAD